jgi:hypothetical protein
VKDRNIPYAICTDVGAGPTTALLAEMVQFLKVHPRGRGGATGVEALYRVTQAPAEILHLENTAGSLRAGGAMSFIEVEPHPTKQVPQGAGEAIIDRLLGCRAELKSFNEEPQIQQAMHRLAGAEITADDLLRLAQDAAGTAQRLAHRVRRVTLSGTCVFLTKQRSHRGHSEQGD